MLDFFTHQVLVYQAAVQGGLLFEYEEQFYKDLSLYIYSYPKMRAALKEEEWSLFLLTVLAKVHRILMNFSFMGPSFLAYFNRILDWQIREYFQNHAKAKYHEWACERELKLQFGRGSEEPLPRLESSLVEKLYFLLDRSKHVFIREKSFKQRFLIFILKNIAFISEDDFLTVFPFLGLEKEEALAIRNQLLNAMQKKVRRSALLEQRRSRNFYSLSVTSKRILNCDDPWLRRKLIHKTKLYRKRLRALDVHLSRIRMVPGNGEIASALGLPKGTVDSALFYMRSHLQDIILLEQKRERLKTKRIPFRYPRNSEEV